MNLSHHKKHYLGLLQSAYLECAHEFGKLMDHDIYQIQVQEIKERAKQQGIDSQIFDQWADEVLRELQQCQRRKVS